jgi:hypothetical protein
MRRRSGGFALAVLAAGCGGSSPVAGDASVADAPLQDGMAGETSGNGDGRLEASASDVGMVDAGEGDVDASLPRACVESMECMVSGNGGAGPVLDCTCQFGSWRCGTPPTGTGALSLPTTDPVSGEACTGLFPFNVACTLPDHCGGLCVCGRSPQWFCGALRNDSDAGDGGPVIVAGVPDGGLPNLRDAGCPWPPCSGLAFLDAGSCSSVDPPQCFTVSCASMTCQGPYLRDCYATQM